MGQTSIVRKEGCCSSRLRDLVVDGEFCHWKVTVPIVLKVVNVGPEVLFHDSIEVLGLSICLWVEGSAETHIDFEVDGKMSPESCNELWSSIGDNGLGKAMESPYFSEEQVSEVFSVDCGVAEDQVALLRETADDDSDGIVSVGRWEADIEVDGDVLPGTFRDRERAEDTMGGVPSRL